jgi:hypothetical protein
LISGLAVEGTLFAIGFVAMAAASVIFCRRRFESSSWVAHIHEESRHRNIADELRAMTLWRQLSRR